MLGEVTEFLGCNKLPLICNPKFLHSHFWNQKLVTISRIWCPKLNLTLSITIRIFYRSSTMLQLFSSFDNFLTWTILLGAFALDFTLAPLLWTHLFYKKEHGIVRWGSKIFIYIISLKWKPFEGLMLVLLILSNRMGVVRFELVTALSIKLWYHVKEQWIFSYAFCANHV
jgi:hypothetical protein